nr:unnamed protein product [Digitaria exilis]
MRFASSAWLHPLATRAFWIAARTSVATRSTAAGSVVSSSFRAGATAGAACLFVPAVDFRTVSTAAPDLSAWFTAFADLRSAAFGFVRRSTTGSQSWA